MTTSKRDMDLLIERINEAAGVKEGQLVGSYQFDYSYGGAQLVQIVSESRAERNVVPHRHPKGIAYQLAYAFFTGLTEK